MPPFFISRNMKSLRERERKKERKKGEKSGTRYKEEDTLSSPGPRNSITKETIQVHSQPRLPGHFHPRKIFGVQRALN